jgi:hypothetical protein
MKKSLSCGYLHFAQICAPNILTYLLGTCGELKCSVVQLLSFGADSRALGIVGLFHLQQKKKRVISTIFE